MAMASFAHGQEAKIHLREFTPRYVIEMLPVTGDAFLLKRRVIDFLQTEGVRAAYWDEASNILTVQYDNKLIQLPTIRSFFLSNQPLTIGKQSKKQRIKPAFLRSYQ